MQKQNDKIKYSLEQVNAAYSNHSVILAEIFTQISVILEGDCVVFRSATCTHFWYVRQNKNLRIYNKLSAFACGTEFRFCDQHYSKIPYGYIMRIFPFRNNGTRNRGSLAAMNIRHVTMGPWLLYGIHPGQEIGFTRNLLGFSFPSALGTHFINLEEVKSWVNLAQIWRRTSSL